MRRITSKGSAYTFAAQAPPDPEGVSASRRIRGRERKPATAASLEEPKLEIEYVDPKDLKQYPGNARTHSPHQIRQICDSIIEFGWMNPILIDAENQIIAGHARQQAAIELGIPSVPTVRVDHLSPYQIRAYVIADNRLAENAGWDPKLLAIELEELSVIPDFDVTVTGFEMAEIDILIGEAVDDAPDGDEIAEEENEDAATVSQPGDHWQIGEHRIVCGSALELASYQTLMGSKRAQLVLTDPPFNVPIAGHVSGLGKVQHREFPMASGELSEVEFTAFLEKAFRHFVSFSKAGSLHLTFMDWRHMREMLEAGKRAYTELKNLCVWVKTNAGMGSLYRSQHELVFVWKNGEAPHINNVELGRFGRNRSNVWTYAGMNAFGKGRDSDLALHPTVKPTALLVDAIQDCSLRGGIVLDPFCGSGSTLVAAEKTGRRGCGIELDPHYVDTAIQRLIASTGHKAIHVQTNLDFDELAAKRARSRSK